MRVCLVSREFAPFWGAGIGTYASNMAAAWTAAGHETHVLSSPYEGLLTRGPDLRPGVRFHAINPVLSDGDAATCRYDFQRYSLRALRTLESLHKEHPFDYVEFPDYWGEGYAAIRARRESGALTGAVLGVRLHTPTTEARRLNDDRASDPEIALLERVEDSAIRDADLLLSPTRALLDLVTRRLHLTRIGPARGVAPYPFGPEAGGEIGAEESPAAAEPSDPGQPPVPTVLYFGRLERRKGVETLVRAATLVLAGGLRCRFQFVGDDTQTGPAQPDGVRGSMVGHLRTLVPPDLFPSISFAPGVRRDRLAPIIRAASASGGVCCFPSHWENFPNVCLEAMSLGACVVGSDAGGFAEIIEPERSGLLFRAGDPEALAAVLRRALTDRALRTGCERRAPERIASLCDPGAVVHATIAAIRGSSDRPRGAVWSGGAAVAAAGQPTRSLRMCLVSRELAPFTGGGIGSYVAQVSAQLASRGHEVHILTAAHPELRSGVQLRPGVVAHSVDLDRGNAALDAYLSFPMRHSMGVLDALKRMSAVRPFDYIEFPDYNAEGYFPIRAKRTLGLFAESVLAVRLHSPSWLCRGMDRIDTLNLEYAQIEHMERAAVAEADLVLAPAPAVLERIALEPPSFASFVHTPELAVLPNPIDHAQLLHELGAGAAPPVTASSDQPVPPPTVLFFGKLQFLKGPQDFVAAALLLVERTNALFHLIGNDSDTGPFGRSMLDYLQSRIPPQHRHRFRFEPARPRAELAGAIRDAAATGGVCVLPSHWESFPMVCLEAMALGAPVIASEVGGLSAIIEHERSGLLCPAADPAALAAAIERTLSDRDRRDRLARHAPVRVRTLSQPDRVLSDLESIIAQISVPACAAPTASAAAASPAVSVLVPFFNLGRYLPETLASLDAQTFRDFETILINDGSTDPASLALLEQLTRTRPDIRILHHANRGLPATRNRAIEEARARFILPLDADDIIAPTLLEKAHGVLVARPELTYVSPMVSYFVESPGDRRGGWIPLGPDRDLLVAQNCGGAASGSLIRRDHAIEAGGYDTRLTSYEDWDFWCRLAKAGRRGTVIPEFLLHYRVRPDSMYRTVATSRNDALHAYILRQHPDLPTNPGRAQRLLLSLSSGTVLTGTAESAARAIISENFRYRAVDKLNTALKRAGLQPALKGLTVRVLRSRKRTKSE